MKVYIDGKEWMETDYLTVNKDLHVKGDFTLDGGGSQTYDTMITGSFKVSGVSGFGTAPKTPRAVVIQALGTAPLRKGLQIRAPAAYQSRYLEILAGSNESNVRFYVGTSQTVNYGTFISGRGSFRSMAPVITPLIGSFGSFTRLSVKGSARASRFYGSVGSFTRVIPGGAGSVGSFVRLTVSGSAYNRYAHGSIGSYTRVPLVNVNIVGAAPALVKTLNGTAQSNPMGIAVDGSWVYIADANQSRIQKRKKSDFSYVSAFSTLTWDVRAITVDHLNAAGQRGSYIYAVHKNNVDGVWMGMKKIRTSDMGLQRELRGSWPRGGGNYGSFLMGASGWFNGIAVREGSVYAADYNRVYKFDRGLTIGTVLISPAKLGVNSHPDGLTTNGTNIFLTTGWTSDSNSVRRYDMLGSMIEQYTGIQNWPWNIVWDKGYLHVANANNAGLQKVEKYQIAPLQKVMEFVTRQPTFGIDADGSWYWLSEVSWAGGATAFIEQWTKGAGNITGAGLIVTAGSFETVVGHLGRFHGTVTVDKAGSFGNEVRAGTFRASKGSFITVAAKGTVRSTSGSFKLAVIGTVRASQIMGTYKKLVQGGSAKPGSAGYIIFGRAFAAAPSAVLTQKDAWAPSIAYGPRIKSIAVGSMQAMGSPAGYAWWQAAGSAF